MATTKSDALKAKILRMATKDDQEVPDTRSIVEIATDFVRKQVSNYVSANSEYDDAKVAAKTVVDEARDTNLGKRATIMIALAKFSADNSLEQDDIKTAVSKAIEAFCAGTNRKPASLNTMGTEFKRAMHAKVRKQVPAIFEQAQKAWSVEKGKPDNQQPLKAEHARMYHYAVGAKGLMGKTIDSDEGTVPTNAQMTAVARKAIEFKSHDPKRAKNAIKRVVDTLTEVYAEFPIDEFQAMIDFAKDLKLSDLKAVAVWEDPDAEDDKPEVVLPVPAKKADTAKVVKTPKAPPTPVEIDDAADSVIGA